jgi:hypothetical protein
MENIRALSLERTTLSHVQTCGLPVLYSSPPEIGLRSNVTERTSSSVAYVLCGSEAPLVGSLTH